MAEFPLQIFLQFHRRNLFRCLSEVHLNKSNVFHKSNLHKSNVNYFQREFNFELRLNPRLDCWWAAERHFQEINLITAKYFCKTIFSAMKKFGYYKCNENTFYSILFHSERNKISVNLLFVYNKYYFPNYLKQYHLSKK